MYKIEKEFIKELHSNVSNDLKNKIEDRFPEVFRDPRYLFPLEFTVTISFNNDIPFGVLYGATHIEQDRLKGLLVNQNYKVVVRNEGANEIIEFHKKYL